MLVKASEVNAPTIPTIPTVPLESESKPILDNIREVSSQKYDKSIDKNIASLSDLKNAIVAGDKNFDNIREDFCDTANDTINSVSKYIDLADRAMQEVLQLMLHDQAVRSEAQKRYDAHMQATSPHYYDKTSTAVVNGKIVESKERVYTYEEDSAAAAAKREAFWNANKSWVWD
ncbi:MAG: hypothetical protein PUC82_01365 [bacterium]|nr:hypothetical protein [bacterium]